MKFYCPACKEVLVRDLRLAITKKFLTPSGKFRSYCSTKGRYVLAKPIARAK